MLDFEVSDLYHSRVMPLGMRKWRFFFLIVGYYLKIFISNLTKILHLLFDG
jgi:hypothetical protein